MVDEEYRGEFGVDTMTWDGVLWGCIGVASKRNSDDTDDATNGYDNGLIDLNWE